MSSFRISSLIMFIVAFSASFPVLCVEARPLTEHPAVSRPAPEFPERDPAAWHNSPPLSMSALRGQVVLLDIWTFACWNCYRSFPWLRALEVRFKDRPLRVIGVHTPEFDREKIRANVAAHIKKYQLNHPVMMDNDFEYWKALSNRYWPAFYLVDKKGIVRAVFVGETHPGSDQAVEIERTIENLLAEK